MKILVTGANGQVGCCLVEQLKQLNGDYLAVGRHELDITDKEKVLELVSTYKPDFIINAAAYTAVDKAEREVSLAYSINEQGAEYLAIAAQSIRATLLHISTDYVFSGDNDAPYKEDDDTNPQSVYGASKLAGEQQIAKHCDKYIILRTAWVFGEHGNNFVKTMINLAKQRDTLNIVGDQFGGPTYAGDIASTLLTIARQLFSGKSKAYGIYHFSGLPHVSWYSFANSIFAIGEAKAVLASQPHVNAISTSEYPTPAKRPANSRLALNKIHSDFGIEASDWSCALERIEHYTS